MKNLKNKLLQRLFPGPADQRKNRLVVVIECILNQNSRDIGAATYSAMNTELVTLCMKHDVGIVQLPCPEMRCLGFLRRRASGQSIRDVLDTESGRSCCKKLSIEIADRMAEYIRHQVAVLAVLGGNPESPGCAVRMISGDSRSRLSEKSGIFIKEFHQELCRRNIEIPFIGVRDCRQNWLKNDLILVEELFRA